MIDWSSLEWVEKYPDKLGCYWFMGYHYGRKSSEKPRLEFVEARKTSNGIACVSCGQFMFSSECEGFFAEFNVPSVPKNISKVINVNTVYVDVFKQMRGG